MDAQEVQIKDREFKLGVWKAIISALTPLVLIALTFEVNNVLQERAASLKRDEQILAEKQKLYAEFGRLLNIAYVYVSDIGDYRSYSPPEVVDIKRKADRLFFMYRPYWSDTTERNYKAFMLSAYSTYMGTGVPAHIRSSATEKIAAYSFDKRQWNADWDRYFTGTVDGSVEDKYYQLVSALLSDIVTPTIRKVTP